MVIKSACIWALWFAVSSRSWIHFAWQPVRAEKCNALPLAAKQLDFHSHCRRHSYFLNLMKEAGCERRELCKTGWAEEQGKSSKYRIENFHFSCPPVFSASLCHFRLIFHSTPLGFRISNFNLLRGGLPASRWKSPASSFLRYILLNLFRSRRRRRLSRRLVPNHEW